MIERLLARNRLVAALFVAAALAAACLAPLLSVDYDMADYLPEGEGSTRAIGIMESSFGSSVPNARVMVEGVGIAEALEYKQRLAAVPGVSDVLWLDDALDAKAPLEAQDQEAVESYYKEGSALFTLTVAEGSEIEAIDAIYAIVGERGGASGQAVGNYSAMRASGTETLGATFILVPLILAILVLTSASWLEPLLFICAIGVAVVINIGVSALGGGISFVTFCVTPILQLAVSLDYAVFLLHAFEDCRKGAADARAAMAQAVRRSLPVILASAMTTVFGFAALCFMDFRLGLDMGLSLVKGVLLSLLCAAVFLPALTLTLIKPLDRARHKPLLPDFQGIGKPLLRIGAPVAICVLIICVPAFMAQSKNDFIYGMGGLSEGTRAESDARRIEAAFGRSVPIAVLVPRGAPAKELLLSDALADTPGITSVVSYAKSVGIGLPAAFVGKGIEDSFYSEGFARIIAFADTAVEGDAAFALVDAVRGEAQSAYADEIAAGGEVLLAGESVTLSDMKRVVRSDNRRVNAISICAIGIVILLTFRRAILPVLLVIAIEAAIWINMSVAYFQGSPLSFIGYLIISAVQLGATVDYAILCTDRYVAARGGAPPKEAARTALGQAFRSILVSAAVLSLAGFTLSATSTNAIIDDLGLLVGRGGLLSLFMVALFLPAMLVWFDRFVYKGKVALK